MSLDTATVRRIASLARIRLEEEEVGRMQAELNGILGWIEQCRRWTPRASSRWPAAAQRRCALRDDAVTDGGIPDQVLANAPDRMGEYFGVPKVVE